MNPCITRRLLPSNFCPAVGSDATFFSSVECVQLCEIVDDGLPRHSLRGIGTGDQKSCGAIENSVSFMSTPGPDRHPIEFPIRPPNIEGACVEGLGGCTELSIFVEAGELASVSLKC